MFTITIVSLLFLCLLVRAESETSRKYQASLITVSNQANAPFYYHTSLEMAVFDSFTNECLDRHSYGIYPDLSRKSKSLLARFYRFLRPLWSCKSHILSPDPLFEGRESKIPIGEIIYREDYPLTAQDFQDLQAYILEWTRPYSYLGWFNTDNCSSWVRHLLDEYYFSKNFSKSNDAITCNRYYFRVPRFMGSTILRFPVSPFDFPKFCHSDSQICKHFLKVYMDIKPDPVAGSHLVTTLAHTSRR